MFSKRRSQEAIGLRINLTPLIDTVFLLLMFFMMTTTFNRESMLKIDLPQTAVEQDKQPEQPIRILINAKGEYAINSWKTALVDERLVTLTRALRKATADQSKLPPLLVSADAKAPHQSVIRAMEAARNLGFISLSFEAQKMATP